jgi:transcription elongation GreA/GreB family factor
MALTKHIVWKALYDQLTDKLNAMQASMDKVQESIEGEEKSSAGDKYETARAMSQNELSRLKKQQVTLKQSRAMLTRFKESKASNEVELGALVQTTSRWLYFIVAGSKMEVENETVFPLSLSSPIGQSMLGKKSGETVVIGNKEEQILKIL